MGGTYPTTMQGNAGFAKVDFNFSPKQLAFVRLEHLAAERHQQRILRPFQPDHRLCRDRQRDGERPDRERRRFA